MDKPSTRKILKIDEFIKQMKEGSLDKQNSKKIEEDAFSPEPKPKHIDINPGDFVEDMYGNRYEVESTTTNFDEADEVDVWDNISKFKDKKDVIFVIVWAREDKEKKFAFVCNVDDPAAVRKIDVKNLQEDDYLQKIYKKALDSIDNIDVANRFKTKWRSFMDKVRTGKIRNEKYIMREILDDFELLHLLKKKSSVKESAINESKKPLLGDEIGDDKFDVSYGDETFYIQVKDGETDVKVYSDEEMKKPVKDGEDTLTFKVKDLFGIDKYVKNPISPSLSTETDTTPAEQAEKDDKEEKEAEEELKKKKKEDKSKKDKKEKSDDGLDTSL